MLKLRKVLEHLLHPLPVLVLGILLCIFLVDAFPADSIHYHLPFAIRAFHLAGYPDYSQLNDSRYFGFPWLWRLFLAPGLALDNPRLFLVPNLLGLLLFSQVCRRYLGLSRLWAACCCLVFPVALFSFRTSLQDFFVNTMVASAMLILLYPLKRSNHLVSWSDCFALLLLALAANTKFQGFFMAVILIGAAVFFRHRDLQFAIEHHPSRSSFKLSVCTIALILAISYQPFMNAIQFRNPFYPIAVAGLPGDIASTISPIQYLPRIPLVFNAASFLVSATEVDPIIRSQAGWGFQRSWHNFNTPKPEYYSQFANHPWVMTGGSNGILFVLLLAVALYKNFGHLPGLNGQLCAERSYQRRLLAACMLFVFLPQSMELRYYMVILIIVSSVALSRPSLQISLLSRYVVIVALWFALIPSFILPIYFRLRTGSWSLDRGLLSPDPYARLKRSVDCKPSDSIGAINLPVMSIQSRENKKPADLLMCSLINRVDHQHAKRKALSR